MFHGLFRGCTSRRRSQIVGGLLLAAVALFAVSPSLLAGSEGGAGEGACMACHGDAGHVRAGTPWISPERYEAGAHAGLGCDDCHAPRDAKGFEVVPHRLAASGPPACTSCHDEFEAIETAVKGDVHRKRLTPFTCVRCHDPHGVSARGALEDVALANRACVRCHREAVSKVVGSRGPKAPLAAHAWLPETKTHLAKNKCVTCHATPEGEGHGIRPSGEATHACAVCHVKPEVLLNVGREEPEMDPVAFTHERHFRFDGHNVACVRCHHEETGDETWDNKWPRYLPCSECHDSPDDEEERASSGPALDEAQDAYRSILHQLCITCHEGSGKKGAPLSCDACHEEPDEKGDAR